MHGYPRVSNIFQVQVLFPRSTVKEFPTPGLTSKIDVLVGEIVKPPKFSRFCISFSSTYFVIGLRWFFASSRLL